MEQATIQYHLPSGIGQSVAELASWVFFLVLLGELAYGEAQKAKILDFYGIKK